MTSYREWQQPSTRLSATSVWTMHARAMAACVSCHPALECHTMQVLHPLPSIPVCAPSPGCRWASLWPQTGLWHPAAAHARPDAARRFPRRSAALQRPAWQWPHGASREWPPGLRPPGSRPQRTTCRCLATAASTAWLVGFQHPNRGGPFASKPLTDACAVLPLQASCTATGQRAGVIPLLRQCAAVSRSLLRLAAPQSWASMLWPSGPRLSVQLPAVELALLGGGCFQLLRVQLQAAHLARS